MSPAAASAASGGAAIAALDRLDDEKHHWGSAADLAVRLLPSLLHTPPGTVFNLNVPDLHVDGIRGLRQASLARLLDGVAAEAERAPAKRSTSRRAAASPSWA